MDIIQPVLDELNAIMVTAFALPATSPNFREVRAARINWRALIEQHQQGTATGLNPPYVIEQLGPMVPDLEWSPMDAHYYRLPLSVYYIDGPQVSIETIETKIQAFHAAVKPEIAFTTFMMVDPGIIDCSDTNPANEVFLAANTPLLAGMWHGELLVSD